MALRCGGDAAAMAAAAAEHQAAKERNSGGVDPSKAMYFKALSQSDAVFQLHVPSGPTEGAVQAGPAAPRPTSNYAFHPAAAQQSTAAQRHHQHTALTNLTVCRCRLTTG